MRLVQFLEKSGIMRVGVELLRTGSIVDLTKIDQCRFKDMKTLLEGGEESMNIVRSALAEEKNVVSKDDVRLIAPITNPDKIICIGMNYTDHCEEIGAPIPTEPIVFSKFVNSITHSGANIIYPKLTEKLDWEAELVFVIGKGGKYISEKDAMEHVAGFTVAHDVSARDWQLGKNGGNWLLGKTFDTFLPLGPALVTKDSISDPHNLGIRCRVNGETMQNSTTKNLVFKTEKIVSYVSQFVTLSPGDIFSTGTPPGVGASRKPPVFLKVGDVVECEIDEIGSIKNQIVADSKL